jgi:hypothetical protein
MAFGDFTVVRSTVKNVLNSSGVLASVAVNTPAFEFNADGSYKGLLVEPGATNLALRSHEFNDAVWVKSASGAGSAPAVTANTTTAPDGTTTADTVALTLNGGVNSADISWIYQNFSLPATTVYTFSVYVKASAPSEIGKQFAYGITSYGALATLTDEWQRITVTQTTGGATTYSAGMRLRGGEVTPAVSFFIWGAQLETGSVATSHIPTVASTVARTADVVTLTSASSLIGQTEGTLYIEVEYIPDGAGRALLNLSASGDDTTRTNNRVMFGTTTSNEFELRSTVGGATQASIISGARTASILKLAGAYAVNDFAFYINGSSIGTDTSGTVPTCANIYLGSNILSIAQYRGWIRSFALFPTRLSNATLASLTA